MHTKVAMNRTIFVKVWITLWISDLLKNSNGACSDYHELDHYRVQTIYECMQLFST